MTIVFTNEERTEAVISRNGKTARVYLRETNYRPVWSFARHSTNTDYLLGRYLSWRLNRARKAEIAQGWWVEIPKAKAL